MTNGRLFLSNSTDSFTDIISTQSRILINLKRRTVRGNYFAIGKELTIRLGLQKNRYQSQVSTDVVLCAFSDPAKPALPFLDIGGASGCYKYISVPRTSEKKPG